MLRCTVCKNGYAEDNRPFRVDTSGLSICETCAAGVGVVDVGLLAVACNDPTLAVCPCNDTAPVMVLCTECGAQTCGQCPGCHAGAPKVSLHDVHDTQADDVAVALVHVRRGKRQVAELLRYVNAQYERFMHAANQWYGTHTAACSPDSVVRDMLVRDLAQACAGVRRAADTAARALADRAHWLRRVKVDLKNAETVTKRQLLAPAAASGSVYYLLRRVRAAEVVCVDVALPFTHDVPNFVRVDVGALSRGPLMPRIGYALEEPMEIYRVSITPTGPLGSGVAYCRARNVVVYVVDHAAIATCSVDKAHSTVVHMRRQFENLRTVHAAPWCDDTVLAANYTRGCVFEVRLDTGEATVIVDHVAGVHGLAATRTAVVVCGFDGKNNYVTLLCGSPWVPKWTVFLGGGGAFTVCSACICADVVYVAHLDGYVVVLNAADGSSRGYRLDVPKPTCVFPVPGGVGVVSNSSVAGVCVRLFYVNQTTPHTLVSGDAGMHSATLVGRVLLCCYKTCIKSLEAVLPW